MGRVAEYLNDSLYFRDIANGGRSTVNVDVVDIFGLHVGIFEGVAHRKDSTETFGMSSCEVVSIGAHAAAGNLSIDLGTAGRACSSSSSTSTTEPSPITNPSRLFEKGREAVLGESLRVEGVHRVETAYTCGVDGSFGTTGDDGVGLAQTDKVERVDDSVVR